MEGFSASLTKQRQAFWVGECAMMFYNSTIFTYAETENVQFADEGNTGIYQYPRRAADHAFLQG